MWTLDDNHDGMPENFPNKIIPGCNQLYNHKGTDSMATLISIGLIELLN
jgi:hypothetical protein